MSHRVKIKYIKIDRNFERHPIVLSEMNQTEPRKNLRNGKLFKIKFNNKTVNIY